MTQSLYDCSRLIIQDTCTSTDEVSLIHYAYFKEMDLNTNLTLKFGKTIRTDRCMGGQTDKGNSICSFHIHSLSKWLPKLKLFLAIYRNVTFWL